MVFEFFKGRSDDTLEVIEKQVQEMLSNDRTTFRYATDALFGRADAAAVMSSLRDSDREVNRAERAIRREMLVFSGVAGGADLPLLLVYMSIIKDIERVGDYAKNIWDVVNDGFVFTGAPDVDAWEALFSRTDDLIGRTSTVFAERDSEAAKALLPEAEGWLETFDSEISKLVKSGSVSGAAVPRALLNRYLKRITAHLMNVMTAIVMPLDRLDYWDEDKVDRGVD
jgi:phosphate uptake regulator